MFDNIVIFTQLVEIGSFSKTADHLSIATSTLTRKIQELETYFNKLLLIRDTRNLKLTPDGELLYQRFKGLREQLQDFLSMLNPSDHINKGEINVILPVIVSLELISPYISHFNQQYPEIKLNLFYQPKDHNMKDGKIDLSITVHSFKKKLPPQYIQRFLRTEYIQFYCTPEYVRKYGLPLNIEQLYDHNVIGGIGIDDNILNQLIFTHKYTKESVIYNATQNNIKTNNPAHALTIGLNGEYIFPCWNYYCEQMVQKGELVHVLPEYYIYNADFYLTSRKSIRPEEQLFIDFIYRCMNRSIVIDALNAEVKPKL